MIRITRTAQFSDRSAAYKIYIDGIYCGKIKGNETKEFAVENGRHIVSASSGSYGSNLLHADVNDSTVDIELRYALTGWNHWLFPFSNGNFAKDEYLFLRVKGAVDVPRGDDAE